MNRRPTYSFVMPAYKGRYLAEAIESVLAQSHGDYELLMVDDCSPEDLAAIVARYDDSRISYLRNPENIGGNDLVAQWQRCLSLARGRYVVLASDDDLYHPDYLAEMHALAQRYPDAGLLYPQVRYIDASGVETGHSEFVAEMMDYAETVRCYCNNRIPGGIAQYMFRLDALQRVGGFVNFATAWRSDDATVLAMAREGVASSPRCLFTFRYSGLNISSQVDDYRLLRRKLQAERQLYDWIQTHLLPDIEAMFADTAEKSALRQALMRRLRMICLSEVKMCGLSTFMRIRREYMALPYLSAREYYRWLLKLTEWRVKTLVKGVMGMDQR